MEIFNSLKELTAHASVSGSEAAISKVIKKMAEPYADEEYTDALLNLTFRKKGAGKRVMIAAHMDTIGLIVTYIEKEGFIRFAAVGGVRVQDLPGVRVRLRENNRTGDIRGVVACEGGVKPADIKLDNLYIDIGAASGDEVEKLVRIGDTAVFDYEALQMSGDMIASAYMDDRIGCLAALEAMKRVGKSPNDLYFVFTTQEEVGIRGAGPAAFTAQPDYSISIDVCLAGDTPEATIKNGVKLGGGAVIKVIDGRTIYHREVVGLLSQTAEENGIPVQYDAVQAGGTDSGAIHISRGGVKSGNISIPTRYIHTPTEIVSESDVRACVDLLVKFLEKPL